MQDVDIARSLAAGDAVALAQVYAKYSDRLYSYALSLVGDAATAADVVQDTLLLALARGGQLRDPTKLRPWLLAIVRNECMRVLRDTNRSTELDGIEDVAAVNQPTDRGLDSTDARQLIDAAFLGMSVGDRDVLDLAFRQDLDVGAVASVLGVSSNNASAKISRAKNQLQTAVGALLLFRSRASGCAALRGALGSESGFTPLVRKRIAAHAEQCAQCRSSRRKAVSIVALAGLAVTAAPSFLRDGLIEVAPNQGATGSAVTDSGSPDAVISDAVDLTSDQMTGIQGTDVEGPATGTPQPTWQARQSAARLDADRPNFDAQGWPRTSSRNASTKTMFATLVVCASVVVFVAFTLGSLSHETSDVGGLSTAVVDVPSASSAAGSATKPTEPVGVRASDSTRGNATPTSSTANPSRSPTAATSAPKPDKSSASPTTSPTATPTSGGGRPTKRPPKDGSVPVLTLAPPVDPPAPIL